MAIPGTWTSFYDWGCTGNYSSTTLTFVAAGTFTDGQGGHGTWASEPGMVTLQYKGGAFATTYSGVVMDRAAVGIGSTFTGSTACWYMIEQNAPTAHAEFKHQTAKLKASGEPH